MIRELSLTGSKAGDITIGVWGSSLSEKSSRDRTLMLIGSVLIASSVAFWPSVPTSGYRWGAALALGAVAGFWRFLSFAPFHTLAIKLREVANARVNSQLGEKPVKSLSKAFSQRFVVYLLSLGAFIYMGILASIVQAITWDDVLNQYKPIFVPVLIFFSLAGGALFGQIHGAAASSARDRRLAKMTEHIEILLNGTPDQESEISVATKKSGVSEKSVATV